VQEDAKLLTIVEAAIKADSEDEEEKLIAERRARRQQILAKHQKQQEETGELTFPPCLVQAPPVQNSLSLVSQALMAGLLQSLAAIALFRCNGFRCEFGLQSCNRRPLVVARGRHLCTTYLR
jgi:hypothetical protein